MMRQIKLLASIQLINLFGWNEMRYTKDRARRTRFTAMAMVWGVLLCIIIGYVAAMSYGYITLGMSEIIPAMLFTLTSLILLFFTFLKAGSIIFQMKSYEMMVSLPVSETAIVVSRFLTMYVTNFLIGLIVMIPGMIVYGMFEHPTMAFYLFGILGTVLLPLLPMTIATALSAGIMALTAKMRHKSIVSAVLMIVVVLGCMAISMFSSGMSMQVNEQMLQNLVGMINEQIAKIYPPAIWFQNAMMDGNGLYFLLLLGVSIVLFVLLMGILKKNFLSVCTALNATSAKNNYKMQKLSANSVIKAMWKREQKRYFASSIYVMNTMIGYILMAVIGVAVFAVGIDRIGPMMDLEEIESVLKLSGIAEKMLPLLLSVAAVIMPPTACSISLEGKNWWLMQTLPIRAKDIWNGKILWNLSLALPFYVIAVLFSILAVHSSVMDIVWIIVMPAVYILFSTVAGITVNLAMPIFEWENETRVVKQSASSLVTMLVGFASVIPAFAALLLLRGVSGNLIYFIVVIGVLAATAVLYHKNANHILPGKE